MDEATASIDIKTDALIQDTISTEFKNGTVLTVAHRINTVLNYDKIMFMDKGKIVEYDSTQNLQNDENSLFHNLVKQYQENN